MLRTVLLALALLSILWTAGNHVDPNGAAVTPDAGNHTDPDGAG